MSKFINTELEISSDEFEYSDDSDKEKKWVKNLYISLETIEIIFNYFNHFLIFKILRMDNYFVCVYFNNCLHFSLRFNKHT